jgi:hypothetical protein
VDTLAGVLPLAAAGLGLETASQLIHTADLLCRQGLFGDR